MVTTDGQNGEQVLAQIGDGSVVPIPSRSPLVVVAAVETPAPEKPDVDATKAAEQNVLVAEAQTETSAKSNELALVAPQPSPNPRINEAPLAADKPVAEQPTIVTASARATQKQASSELRKPGLLARLFKRPKVNVGARDDRSSPILKSSRTASRSNRIAYRKSRATMMAMPGVKSNDAIFGIKRQSVRMEVGKNVRLASAAGMLSRLSPNALKTQHSGVNVDCIRPEVLRLISIIERRYRKKAVVTSGYRSPSRNRKAGGARNSMHIYCKAVDIQVEGVSKWDLAKFMRTIPGRGGVGTYCRTKSVHIDIGPKRDWHHSCRRKSKRRRKA